MTDDWRLTGQQTWLADRNLQWRQWTAYRPGWHHDHCAFCHAEIAEHADFTAGYVTADDQYTWICPPCFNDFNKQFQWHLIPTSTDS